MSITKEIPEYTGTVPDKDSQTPSEFNDAADAYVDWYANQPDNINTWAGQANTTASDVNSDKNDAETARSGAETAETNAVTARDYANQWATESEDTLVDDGTNPTGYSAFHWAQKTAKGERLTATSSSSVTIGTGSKAFTLVESYRAFTTGSKVRISDNSDPSTNYMIGTVTGYDSGTDELAVDVATTGGSGTISNWSIGLKASGDADTVNGIDFTWTLSTSACTVGAGDKILADTSSSAFTITLPSGPSSGDVEIQFADSARNWGTNNLTIDGNGNNILGSSTFVVDVDDWAFGLVFNGTQWIFSNK